jgi:AcrR family transcriptional regulator
MHTPSLGRHNARVATINLRAARAVTTREAILSVAERLFAERGVFAVSNRQISEAAGQGNNTAVGYHFGTKTDLIRAIVAEHTDRMDDSRRRLLAAHEGSTDLRDWVVVTVRPVTDHLATLGTPSWYARFAAQLMTDPALRDIMTDQALHSPTTRAAADGLVRSLPALPADVRAERHGMVRALLVHACAERERTLADAAPEQSRLDAGAAWRATELNMVDAIVGLLSAPPSA